MKVFYPPQQIKIRPQRVSIFLAGTIDNGESEDWQSDVIQMLELLGVDADIYNPRRPDWDGTVEQSFENPVFYQQVNWELDAMEKADVIIVNILEDSKSPITLLEIGLHINSKKLLVCCPDNFYRSGNIQVVCDRYNIPLFDNMQELAESFLIYNQINDR